MAQKATPGVAKGWNDREQTWTQNMGPSYVGRAPHRIKEFRYMKKGKKKGRKNHKLQSGKNGHERAGDVMSREEGTTCAHTDETWWARKNSLGTNLQEGRKLGDPCGEDPRDIPIVKKTRGLIVRGIGWGKPERWEKRFRDQTTKLLGKKVRPGFTHQHVHWGTRRGSQRSQGDLVKRLRVIKRKRQER